ncbi:hypothetical protein QWY28_06590 [Nocardioides sp. SOB77]|uniref:Winged helix-turn-helix domain-containing protein n=1 Tax=Nocardioides oceani TaxID=3058369 RepID=A0ABT8FD54_9ACTN|nr:hypothetical protein [Nocardioides oceani]MDN4172603.1 hypothetical protein [Nocardioides oceani]
MKMTPIMISMTPIVPQLPHQRLVSYASIGALNDEAEEPDVGEPRGRDSSGSFPRRGRKVCSSPAGDLTGAEYTSGAPVRGQRCEQRSYGRHRDRSAFRWTRRDYPVLVEVARRYDARADIDASSVAATLNLSEDDVIDAITALGHAQYLAWEPLRMLSGDVFVQDLWLLERGRRAVGLWPPGETADALVDALRQAEERTLDPEEKP